MSFKRYASDDDSAGGVWRTIGGRRIFIKDGQDLASAMKESGKFSNSNRIVNGMKKLEARKNEKGTYIEDLINQYNNNIEAGKTNYKSYQSLKKEIAERRKLLKKDNEEYKLYKRAIENPDSIDPMTEWSTDWEALDKKYNQKNETEKYYSKMSEKDIVNDLEERKNRLDNDYYDEKDKEKYQKFYEEGKKYYNEKYKIKVYEGQYEKISNDIKGLDRRDAIEIINKELDSGNITQIEARKLQNELDKRDKFYYKKDDMSQKPSKVQEQIKFVSKMNGIEYDDNFAKFVENKHLDGFSGENLKKLRNENDKYNGYQEYYKKENLGKPSNYQKGDKVEFSDGYYSTIKGSIVREATDSEKKYQMNSNLKGYVVRDSYGNEHIVADVRIKSSKNEVGNNSINNTIRRKAYQKYLKEHPNSKMTFENFIKNYE